MNQFSVTGDLVHLGLNDHTGVMKEKQGSSVRVKQGTPIISKPEQIGRAHV